MFSFGIIKAIGIGATVLGMGASLATDWVNERKMDKKIEEKVDEAMAKYNQDKEEEEAL